MSAATDPFRAEAEAMIKQLEEEGYALMPGSNREKLLQMMISGFCEAWNDNRELALDYMDLKEDAE